MAQDGCATDVVPVGVAGRQLLELGRLDQVDLVRDLQLAGPANKIYERISLGLGQRKRTTRQRVFRTSYLLLEEVGHRPHALGLINVFNARHLETQ